MQLCDIFPSKHHKNGRFSVILRFDVRNMEHRLSWFSRSGYDFILLGMIVSLVHAKGGRSVKDAKCEIITDVNSVLI